MCSLLVSGCKKKPAAHDEDGVLDLEAVGTEVSTADTPKKATETPKTETPQTKAQPGGTPQAAPSEDTSKNPATPATDTLKQETHAGLVVQHLTRAAAPGESLPWIIALHGRGDRAARFLAILKSVPVRAHLYVPEAPIASGSGASWYEVPARHTEEQETAAVSQAAQRVTALIDELGKDKKNKGRAIITGFSQGATLSFAAASMIPEQIKIAIPVSGNLPPGLWPKLKGKPGFKPEITALHGTQDTIAPIQLTRDLIETLKDQGFRAHLDEFPAKHTISLSMQQSWFGYLSVAARDWAPGIMP